MEEETNRASEGWALGDSCRTQRGLSTITARPVDNQRPLRMKRRSDWRRRKCRRLTDEAEGCRSSLKTTRRHRERPDVGPHHICLDRKAPPTTTKGEDTGVHSRTHADRQAGRSRSGCLPRILLGKVVYLQQPNGSTRSALPEALEGGLTMIL